MNNLVQNENSQFGSFQSNIGAVRRTSGDLAAWAQSTDGLYPFLSRLPPPRRQDRACRPLIQRAHTAVPERARRRRRRRGLIYRSPGRPLLRRRSSTLPALIVWRARARRLSRSPDIMSRQPAPAARRRSLLAITQPHAGATKELLALPPTISGTVAGQSTPSGQPDTPFSSVTIADRNIDTSDSLSIQLTGGGGTLADGAGFDGLTTSAPGVYTPFGDRGCDHQRTRRACFYSEHVLRDDDIYFDRHDEPRYEREQREHDRDSDEWRASRRVRVDVPGR